MDVFETLMQDHRVAEQRFAEIERTTDKETERRERLFKELRACLEAHEIFEEEVLYPEIEQFPTIKRLIGHASEAHAEFDAILQELSEMPVARDEWMDGIRELKDMIHEHVRMEDETMFPAARAELAETRAEELGRRIEERQKEV
jgi:iron-sulfur cluster repair protein YtfE (RIC family)